LLWIEHFSHRFNQLPRKAFVAIKRFFALLEYVPCLVKIKIGPTLLDIIGRPDNGDIAIVLL